MIHPTAIVSPEAEVSESAEIGPYAIVRENVRIGDKTVIGPHAVIDPYVEMGSECQVFQFASVGAVPQSLKFQGKETWATIGDRCTIREFVTINRGTEDGGGITRIGNDCLLMAYAHVAHDCIIGNNVILANNATLAGHVIIEDHASVGGLVAIHQFVRVGQYAYLGGKSAVVKDIPPYVIASGDRAKLHGLNLVGLKRQGFSQNTIKQLKDAYRLIFRIGLTLNEAIERVAAEIETTPEVDVFMGFIKSSERGLTR